MILNQSHMSDAVSLWPLHKLLELRGDLNFLFNAGFENYSNPLSSYSYHKGWR